MYLLFYFAILLFSHLACLLYIDFLKKKPPKRPFYKNFRYNESKAFSSENRDTPLMHIFLNTTNIETATSQISVLWDKVLDIHFLMTPLRFTTIFASDKWAASILSSSQLDE